MKEKKRTRRLWSYWKWILWGLVVLVCLILFLVFLHGDRKAVAELTDQAAYARWQTEEKPYGQASVYLKEGDGISQDSLAGIRLSIEKALTAGGVPSEDYPWYFAASRTESAELTGEKTSAKVELTLIYGDYFWLHPLPVRYGWYMDKNAVMRDQIVLDRQTAWELFSADNVAGQFLTWNGQRYQVAAVVDYAPGTYNEMAAEGTNRAWVFSDSPGAASMASGGEGETPLGEASGFTTMEMVLPQPVKNFAISTMQSALKELVPEDTVYVDSAARFSLENRWNVLRHIGTRGISSKGILYPHYENAAMLTENHLALRLIPEAIFLGIPLLSLILLLLWLNKRRTWGLHSIKDWVSNLVDKKRQRDYYKNQHM